MSRFAVLAVTVLSLSCFFLSAVAADKDEKKNAKEEIKKELTKMEGLWIFDEGESDGKVFGPRQGEEAVYIEEDKMLWTNKKGTDRAGQTAKITIDPTKTPKTIDLRFTKGSLNGKTSLGIYKLEDGVLEIATNEADNEKRPAKFTTKLTAKSERAHVVRKYKLAKE